MVRVNEYFFLCLLTNDKIVLSLILFNFKSTANSSPLQNEQLDVENQDETLDTKDDILHVNNDFGSFSPNNRDVGINLLLCLRLYKFRSEVTFTDNFEDVGLIGAGLIGPLYRAAYNGDLSCAATIVNEIQGCDIMRGNIVICSNTQINVHRIQIIQYELSYIFYSY